MSRAVLAGLGALGVGALALLWARAAPPPTRSSVVLGDYATRLTDRTPAQRRNAVQAAQRVSGARIAPGGVFSFCRAAGAWGQSEGYVKAPVSYDGELVRAFGGGVCQTSTTLYNAALLAGLEIVERHPHTVAPHYVPPGRDAAVAYPGIDLRLRNPYPFPITLEASVRGTALSVRVRAPRRPTASEGTPEGIVLRTQTLDTQTPRRRLLSGSGSGRKARGATGWRVVAWREWPATERGAGRRERLSDDTYRAFDRIVAL